MNLETIFISVVGIIGFTSLVALLYIERKAYKELIERKTKEIEEYANQMNLKPKVNLGVTAEQAAEAMCEFGRELKAIDFMNKPKLKTFKERLAEEQKKQIKENVYVPKGKQRTR